MRNLLLLATTLLYFCASSQDAIFLKTGDEIKCKVIKVGVSEVEYKKDTISPLYSIKKSDVFMIKYASGSKDVFANLATVEPKRESFDDLKLKYERHKRGGIALLVIGGSLLIAGASVMPADDGSGGALIAGGCLMGASIPLLISGGTEIHKYAKYKRQWKEAKRSLSFAPNGISINF